MADKEKDVQITISAKNLTEAEFKKVTKGLGGIENAADKTSKKTSVLSRTFQSFGKAAPGALKAVTIGAGAAAAAIGAATAAVIKLGERGAAVDDVKSQFNALSEAAGETGAVMLQELAAGVKGTISDMDLMKVANKALGSGLLDSAKDARTMSEGSRLLAKRTGTDTVQAFNMLTSAMASGRTAQLKQIGLFVDNKAAIEAYSEATGKSVAEMTDADRAAALQQATMAALRGEIANFPPPLADFGELIERGRVGVKNLVDGLAVMISNSPVLLSGMRAAGDAISAAFGEDKNGLILMITRGIEKAAFFALGLARAAVQGAQLITQGWGGIKVLIFGTALALSELTTKFTETAATVLETASVLPGLGESFGSAAEKVRSVATAGEQVNARLREQVDAATQAALGHDTLGQALTRGVEIIDTVNQSMVDAGTTQSDLNTVMGETTQAVTTAGAATEGLGTKVGELTPFYIAWREEMEKTKTEIALFDEETLAHFDSTKNALAGFVPVVSGVGDTVAAQTGRMAANFAFFGEKSRAELAATADEAEERFREIEASGTESQEKLLELWEKVEEMKREAQGETEEYTLGSNEAIVTGGTQLLQQLGAKNKAAAIAAALISTYQAVAKALAAAPWPANLPMAAGALAAGMMAVNNIRKQKEYREGTPGLDFQNFGVETAGVALHGMEAVVPQGGGHALGREVASELARIQPARASDELNSELRGMFGELRRLPLAIQRSVRDGILLAG